MAETSKQSLGKGSLVYIVARLQSRHWKDGKGVQHSSIEIVAQDVILLSHNKSTNAKTDQLDDFEEPLF